VKAETPIVKAVIAAVNASGLAFVWRNQSGVVRAKGGYVHLAPNGSPDRVGFARAGLFVGLECKVEGSKTEKERAGLQAEWRARIIAAGGIAGEVRNAAEAIELLARRTG
jgi:hypothetical protein